MTKHRRRSAGRPRKAGDRHPSGRLKYVAPKPNERVLAEREALMGSAMNLDKADDPLDLAFHRGWLTEMHHRAGRSFRSIHARANLGGPRMGNGSPREVEEAKPADKRPIREMGRGEIVDAWDQVMNVADPIDRATAQEEAMGQWVVLCSILLRDERAEVELVCLQRSWPQWVIHRSHGHMDTPWEKKRDLLVSGLEKIAKALRPPPAAAQTVAPEIRTVDEPAAPMGPKLNETTFYVDDAGAKVLEVVRKVRARL